MIVETAKELGKKVIKIDQGLSTIDWRDELSVDQEKYDGYVRKYIKMDGSVDEPVWSTVAKRLEEMKVCMVPTVHA